jgi:hypothetical protein
MFGPPLLPVAGRIMFGVVRARDFESQSLGHVVGVQEHNKFASTPLARLLQPPFLRGFFDSAFVGLFSGTFTDTRQRSRLVVH